MEQEGGGRSGGGRGKIKRSEAIKMAPLLAAFLTGGENVGGGDPSGGFFVFKRSFVTL